MNLNANDLTSKLQVITNEEDEAEQKRKEFEEKRKKHYANEFNMAKLLK